MSSVGVSDQPVNKKDVMQERFESLLNKHETTGNSAMLTHEKLLSLISDVKNAKIEDKKVPRVLCWMKRYLFYIILSCKT